MVTVGIVEGDSLVSWGSGDSRDRGRKTVGMRERRIGEWGHGR